MWEVETEGIRFDSEMSPEEKKVVAMTNESLKLENGRYQVAIPWRENEPNLVNNREAAVSRLVSLERSLKKRPEVAAEYKRIMQDHIDKGYVREVPTGEQNLEKSWFLPHFPVVRMDKSSTKYAS